MTLHPLLQPLADLAPEGMPWFCVTKHGEAYWQTDPGDFEFGLWMTDGDYQNCNRGAFPERDPFAINTITGAIRLKEADGTITEVTQAEWSAMP
jgi:hypothetical protein